MSLSSRGNAHDQRAGTTGGSWLQTLLMLPAGRRAKWIIVALWLVAVIALGSSASKLQNVTSNDPANFTPSGAQSTKVGDLDVNVFPHGKESTAIVVYHRQSGLTAADLSRMRADLAYFSGPGRLPQSALPVPGPVSSDRRVASFSIALLTADQPTIKKLVDRIRQRVPREAGGLDMRVTGPAGLLTDILGLVSSIDGVVLVATLALVLILLLAIYRSPLIAILPIVTVGFAYTVAAGIIYMLAKNAGLTLNGAAGFLLPVLMFGAGTDYALLLTSRYREELRRQPDHHVAMAETLRTESRAILSSGGTVLLAMLVLMLATLRSTHDFGPVLAIGIGTALLAGLTLLPAMLQIIGRRAFWPVVPRVGDEHVESGFWAWVAHAVARRPVISMVSTVILMLVMALGLTQLQEKQNQLNGFRSPTDATEGFAYIQASEPAGLLSPTVIDVQPASALPGVVHSALQVPGILPSHIPPIQGKDNWAKTYVILRDNPYSQAAQNTISSLRSTLARSQPSGSTVLVGGDTAVTKDTQDANNRDIAAVAPAVLVVILLILIFLLRTVVAPIYLIATVVLSYAASLGVSVMVFRYLLGFEGIDASLPVLVFIFLVALGVDYNIFLMSRVREEAAKYGTRMGTIRGLTLTGGVITSAGLILAGTFSALLALPFKQLMEIGFAVAFGVLFDTFVVRSVLVPSIVTLIGDRSWWPSRVRPETTPEQPPVAPAPVKA